MRQKHFLSFMIDDPFSFADYYSMFIILYPREFYLMTDLIDLVSNHYQHTPPNCGEVTAVTCINHDRYNLRCLLH